MNNLRSHALLVPGNPAMNPGRGALLEELFNLYGAALHLPGIISLQFCRLRHRFMWKISIRAPQIAKRLIDVMASFILLIMIAPFFLIIAILIKLTDGGPVFFWQTRVGKWGKEFPFPKFRSMVIDADRLKDSLIALNDHGKSITFKMKADPRVTWIGRIIRRLSIDELPQLWNVFIGDMSLVGPRPSIPREVNEYTLSDRKRLDVTPGLTCIWQVSGRGDIPFNEQVKMDIEYVESHNLRMDLKLLLLTIPAVLSGRGAY